MPQLGAFCLSPEAAEQATIPRRGSLSWFPHTHLGRGWHCVPACTSWPSPATKWPPRPRQHLEPRGNGCPVSDVTGHVACPSALYLAVPPQPHAQSNQAWMFVPLGPLSSAISQSTGHREVGWGCWWPGGPLGGLGRQSWLWPRRSVAGKHQPDGEFSPASAYPGLPACLLCPSVWPHFYLCNSGLAGVLSTVKCSS